MLRIEQTAPHTCIVDAHSLLQAQATTGKHACQAMPVGSGGCDPMQAALLLKGTIRGHYTEVNHVPHSGNPKWGVGTT